MFGYRPGQQSLDVLGSGPGGGDGRRRGGGRAGCGRCGGHGLGDLRRQRRSRGRGPRGGPAHGLRRRPRRGVPRVRRPAHVLARRARAPRAGRAAVRRGSRAGSPLRGRASQPGGGAALGGVAGRAAVGHGHPDRRVHLDRRGRGGARCRDPGAGGRRRARHRPARRQRRAGRGPEPPGGAPELGPRPVTARHRGARDRAVVRRRASGRPPARRGDGARAARRGRRPVPRAGPAAGARPRGRRARRGLERGRSALAQDVVDAGDVRSGLRSGAGACRPLRCRARHRRHVAAQPAPGAPGPPRPPRAARSVSRRHPRDPGGWRLVRRHPAAGRSGLPGRRRCRGSRRARRVHHGPAARRAASTDAHARPNRPSCSRPSTRACCRPTARW